MFLSAAHPRVPADTTSIGCLIDAQVPGVAHAHESGHCDPPLALTFSQPSPA